MSQAVTTVEPRQKSILLDMADRFHMEPAAFEATVRATCMPTDNRTPPATREEFAAFLLVAKEYGLNPILKEIYAFPRRGGGVVPVVSVDGWVNLINSHPMCDGFEFEWEHNGQGVPVSCTCKMYRKDRGHPVSITEYYSECYRPTDPWKMANRMLRHKALIQAARYAFGFAGIYDEDEAARIAQMNDMTPPTARPQLVDYKEPEPEPDTGTDQTAESEDDEPAEDETEPDAYQFINQFGEIGEEPLIADDFISTLCDAMDECDVGAAVKALLDHNADAIESLPDDLKDQVEAHKAFTRDRIKTLIEDAKRKEKGERDTNTETSESEEAPTDSEAAEPSTEADTSEKTPPPPAAHVIELLKDDKGRPREREYMVTVNKKINAAKDPATIDAITEANMETIRGLSPAYGKPILRLADDRKGKIE